MEKKFQCECCGEVKNIDEYYVDNRRARGHKTVCKSCMRKRYYEKRREKIQYQLEWNNLNKDKVKEYMQRYLSKKAIC